LGVRMLTEAFRAAPASVVAPFEYTALLWGVAIDFIVWSKLPFSVPDSPLEEARREWIEGQGRSYFMEVTVPETAQRFKQGLGRLIRTTEDWGVVTVLDNRLITKRWGSLLMRGIPDFERVMEPRVQTQRHRQRDAALRG